MSKTLPVPLGVVGNEVELLKGAICTVISARKPIPFERRHDHGGRMGVTGEEEEREARELGRLFMKF